MEVVSESADHLFAQTPGWLVGKCGSILDHGFIGELCERVKLATHRVGGERPARRPRPLDCAFAFRDPLLKKPTTRTAPLMLAGMR